MHRYQVQGYGLTPRRFSSWCQKATGSLQHCCKLPLKGECAPEDRQPLCATQTFKAQRSYSTTMATKLQATRTMAQSKWHGSIRRNNHRALTVTECEPSSLSGHFPLQTRGFPLPVFSGSYRSCRTSQHQFSQEGRGCVSVHVRLRTAPLCIRLIWIVQPIHMFF